ncbi:Mu transposase domain-containing protein [Pseudonocardia saturnea]
MDAHALRRQGWTISAIARHLGHDRKTIRSYLSGGRVAGERAAGAEDPLGPYVGYVRQRLLDDPHVWASTLFDEVAALGFDRSYPRFTHGLRRHRLRPHCEPCQASNGREHTVIDHPAGEEVHWDCVELPDPPAQWGHGAHAHLLVGALPHSGRWRGVLAESEDQAHLIEALHAVSARLGGLPKRWRFDRMAIVASPNTGRVTATFAAVAKHYGVGVDLCPPRHGNRKGTVEKANHSAAQRWWRTVADEFTVVEAQVSLDGFCARVGDGRARRRDGAATTVGMLAAAEPLAPLPSAFPATVRVERTVSAQALVAFRGNTYSVPPGLAGAKVTVSHRLAAMVIDIATNGGTVLARHRRELDGAGVAVRDQVHVAALETAVLAAFDTSRPCPRKVRRPPSPAALAEAEHLHTGTGGGDAGAHVVVVDLAVWAAAARDRRVAP